MVERSVNGVRCVMERSVNGVRCVVERSVNGVMESQDVVKMVALTKIGSDSNQMKYFNF